MVALSVDMDDNVSLTSAQSSLVDKAEGCLSLYMWNIWNEQCGMHYQ